MRIDKIHIRPLSIPLIEPFVIASTQVETTPAALVRIHVVDELSGRSAVGLGEASALPPLTKTTAGAVLAHLRGTAGRLIGATFRGHSDLAALLDDAFAEDPVARAGVEMALLDAWARTLDVPVHALLGTALLEGDAPPPEAFALHTDITIPIAEPHHMAATVGRFLQRGFSAFKVKVGKDAKSDARALEAIAAVAPQAEIRLDGNAGLSGKEAMGLISVARSQKLNVTCFEQPCAVDDTEGLRLVTALAGCPVIADESVTSLADLERVHKAGTATGVNLKIQKLGGLVAATRLGRAAQRQRLALMVGAMVETRLGLAAMAHCARALLAGGAQIPFVDLDTALLLKSDPFDGGYQLQGHVLTLMDGPGLTVKEAAILA